MTSLSIIIPAFNEEAALPATLAAVRTACQSTEHVTAEIVVVDNASSDQTATIARLNGARVVEEPVQSIARARNRGAAESNGQHLLFLDADVTIPIGLLAQIAQVLENPSCLGGGCEVRYPANKRSVRLYLWTWRVLGRSIHAVQGAAQFVRRDIFEVLGGYDETIWMGEDVDFSWRLRKLARTQRKQVVTLREHNVTASPRRFDQWPLLRTLVYTNPLFVSLSRRRRGVWSGWYLQPPR
ncbi:MAG: glycosyltransferase [Gemmatimonadales bacterium]